MENGLKQQELESIRHIFSSFPEVEKAILYGSRAKGTYRPNSDIDISLKGTELTLKIINQISWQLDDLLLPYTFDLSNFNHIHNSALIDHIERIGKVIYERSVPKITIDLPY
ncbi:MAG TPA: nucleotidyltransferase domain-containing protein [Prolixibacteraceae bacterium]|jgi:predicted nucleotidyltransferase